VGGQADEFARWIVKELKPKIDAQYRTLPDRSSTWIAGSSLGGLFALYVSVEHNQVFGGAVAMSPSLFWGNEKILDLFNVERSTWNKPTSIWVDFGDKESKDVNRAREHVERFERLKQKLGALAQRSKADDEIRLGGRVFAGAAHHEPAWRDRFGEAIQFIVNTK
jgi:predicted alpha/beta superfamily hydrolase